MRLNGEDLDVEEPELSGINNYLQRERDAIAYLFGILEDLGGDTGPGLDTLTGILKRVKFKARAR